MTVEQYFYKAASTVVVWHWEPFYVPCAAGYRYYPAAFSLFRKRIYIPTIGKSCQVGMSRKRECRILSMSTKAQTAIKNIERLYPEKNLTPKELYDQAGISKSAFYRKMAGEVDFTLGELERISSVLDCSIEDLLKETE